MSHTVCRSLCRRAGDDEAAEGSGSVQQSRSVRLQRVTLGSEGGDVTVSWWESLAKLLAFGSPDDCDASPATDFCTNWSVSMQVRFVAHCPAARKTLPLQNGPWPRLACLNPVITT